MYLKGCALTNTKFRNDMNHFFSQGMNHECSSVICVVGSLENFIIFTKWKESWILVNFIEKYYQRESSCSQ